MAVLCTGGEAAWPAQRAAGKAMWAEPRWRAGGEPEGRRGSEVGQGWFEGRAEQDHQGQSKHP